jgi:zinc/manganese transport system substrate-binding protein
VAGTHDQYAAFDNGFHYHLTVGEQMVRRPVRLLVPVAVACLATGLGACSSTSDGGPANTASDAKIAVAASTNVWASVAAAVGGDAVSVTSLIDSPSADPHAYEAKPEDATALSEAKLALYNGGGYDDFFVQLADAAPSKPPRIEAFALSGKAEGSGDAPSGQTSAAPAEEGEVNEHVWYDLPTVKKVADRVAEDLGAIAPDRKATFAENAKSFNADIDELMTKLSAIADARPGAQVVATEPVAAYLLQAAGLRDSTPPEFSEAIEEETDPPAEAVAQMTDLIRNRQVVAVINNPQTETPVTQSLKDAASQAGVPVVDMTETLPQGVTSYVDWMAGQIDKLAGALAAK